MVARVASLLIGTALAACTAEPPPIPNPPGTDAGTGGGFADTVISVSQSGALITCSDQLPSCDAPGTGNPPCYPNAALGPNDGQFFALNPGDILEVAFRCGLIVDRATGNGSPAPDFEIWSTLDTGASGVVEVSFDGVMFRDVEHSFTISDQSFDLAAIPLEAARFVRITNTGSSQIQIDAVQAL